MKLFLHFSWGGRSWATWRLWRRSGGGETEREKLWSRRRWGCRHLVMDGVHPRDRVTWLAPVCRRWSTTSWRSSCRRPWATWRLERNTWLQPSWRSEPPPAHGEAITWSRAAVHCCCCWCPSDSEAAERPAGRTQLDPEGAAGEQQEAAAGLRPPGGARGRQSPADGGGESPSAAAGGERDELRQCWTQD